MFLLSDEMFKKAWDLENVQLLPLEIQISFHSFLAILRKLLEILLTLKTLSPAFHFLFLYVVVWSLKSLLSEKKLKLILKSSVLGSYESELDSHLWPVQHDGKHERLTQVPKISVPVIDAWGRTSGTSKGWEYSLRSLKMHMYVSAFLSVSVRN